MNRGELVRLLVLNAICDDYENLDQVILRDVAQSGVKCGLTIERPEVVDALSGLIRDGLAKADILSSRPQWSTELQGMPPLDIVEIDFKTYFYITEKGMQLQLADDLSWPFGADGTLLPNWHLEP